MQCRAERRLSPTVSGISGAALSGALMAGEPHIRVPSACLGGVSVHLLDVDADKLPRSCRDR